MNGGYLTNKSLVFGIIFLLFGMAIIPSINCNVIEVNNINGNSEHQDISSFLGDGILDSKYIYNITKALSDIIFTEYNETAGELAKGRYFGTKGEHNAAEILYENMTKLGLNTTMEKIENTPMHPKLTHNIDVLDYGLKINNKTIESHEFHIVPSKIGPRDNPNQLDYNFSFIGLKVKRMPKLIIPWAFLNRVFPGGKENFVFIKTDASFIPEAEPLIKRIIFRFINHLRYIGIPMLFSKTKKAIQLGSLYKILPNWQGTIGYDLNENTYNMGAAKHHLPLIYINGTLGKKILEDIDNVTIDYYINQSYNESVISYNVIGQLNGTDPTKTVIVDCLYDSWWCQGTADAAIGMAMVLGVAKYFVEHNITPKYNMKFIGFGGEEVGVKGANYYEYAHRDENIVYVIDLNQIGFRQEEPRLSLNIIANKFFFLNKIWKIAKKTDYVKKVNNTAGIRPVWMPTGAPSDDQVFAMKRPFRCKTVCFLKSYYWVLHHRDGQNHQEGDVLKYFDWDDVNATGEIVLNIVKYLATEW